MYSSFVSQIYYKFLTNRHLLSSQILRLQMLFVWSCYQFQLAYARDFAPQKYAETASIFTARIVLRRKFGWIQQQSYRSASVATAAWRIYILRSWTTTSLVHVLIVGILGTCVVARVFGRFGHLSFKKTEWKIQHVSGYVSSMVAFSVRDKWFLLLSSFGDLQVDTYARWRWCTYYEVWLV